MEEWSGEEVKSNGGDALNTLKEIAKVSRIDHLWQAGFVYMKPCYVGRNMYCGRDIIAKNSTTTDERGYYMVERWIASMTVAKNGIPKESEGLSFLLGNDVSLDSVKNQVLGDYSSKWPLVKLLDIGGPKVNVFGKLESPPIPVHVHSGECIDGSLCGNGKLEAYHFPEPPFALENDICVRLGFKSETKRDDIFTALEEFGKSDKMYGLCKEYSVRPGDGWTIRPGVVHSPAPFPTLEMQLPQDDFNMLAFKLGCRVSDRELEKLKEEILLKGLKDCNQVIDEAICMEGSMDVNFERNNKRPQKLIESGSFGVRTQTFFDEFYGECLTLNDNMSYVIKGDERPFSLLVWKGSGTLNGKELNTSTHSEIVVLPSYSVDIKASSEGLIVYLFFPFK